VEYDNLRAVLAWSQEETSRLATKEEHRPDRRSSLSALGASDIGLRLVAALTWFWILRCSFTEGSRWLAGALQRSSAIGPPTARAKALYGAGILAMHQGDYAAAAPRLDQALAIFRAAADQHGIDQALMNRGYVAYNQGDYAAAGALIEESLPILHAVGDTSARPRPQHPGPGGLAPGRLCTGAGVAIAHVRRKRGSPGARTPVGAPHVVFPAQLLVDARAHPIDARRTCSIVAGVISKLPW
jgi:tetratricopeptide (TPR) repeat protein